MIKAIRTRTISEPSSNHWPISPHRGRPVGHPIGKDSYVNLRREYRVVGIESDRLMVRGVHSGEVLTIINLKPSLPCQVGVSSRQFDSPVGPFRYAAKLIKFVLPL